MCQRVCCTILNVQTCFNRSALSNPNILSWSIIVLNKGTHDQRLGKNNYYYSYIFFKFLSLKYCDGKRFLSQEKVQRRWAALLEI